MTIQPGRPRRSFEDGMRARRERRRERVRGDLQRSRGAGHRVPTWVMAVVLAVLVLSWAALVIWS